MPPLGPYATAREYFERALSIAQALGRRSDERIIGQRLCELIEMDELREVIDLRAARDGQS